MSTGPVFLLATAQDLPAIRALVREAYEPYVASIGQEPAPLHAEVRLYTNAKMFDNLTYYPRRGYRLVERRTDNGFDRVHFVKPIG